jgi:hypothetical protein
VLKGKLRAALIRPEAGALSGSVHSPDGDASPRHPWATVTFLEPAEEASLRSLLGASADFEDFRRRLKAAGYAVEPLPK